MCIDKRKKELYHIFKSKGEIKNMKITKDKGTTVVEVSKGELMKYDLTFQKLDCSSLHTRNAIKEILSDATGENFFSLREIHLLPDKSDGCVIVLKEKLPFAVSFSSSEKEGSEIFSCLFS